MRVNSDGSVILRSAHPNAAERDGVLLRMTGFIWSSCSVAIGLAGRDATGYTTEKWERIQENDFQ